MRNLMPQHNLSKNFQLESGQTLKGASLYYEVLGEISDDREVIWVCHAFTGSATVKDWWASLFLENGGFIDLEKHTVICANMLGSCYGSTGPDSLNPETNTVYGDSFPNLQNRDVVKAFIDLREALRIYKIDYLIGGSLGGQQALEWSVLEPEVIQKQILVASNANHSPWGIAFNELQRQAIELGENGKEEEKQKALSLARSIAMLSYRGYHDFEANQNGKIEQGDWKVASYLKYQGKKFNGRFSINSYKVLSKMMDAHNIAENKGDDLKEVLGSIKTKTLCIGIDSDNLFPVEEQKFMSDNIPSAKLEIIKSSKGHDAFLIEGNLISQFIEKHLINTLYEEI
ncbi:homoserine O-acetyltransferase [Marivirga tractuosa]|uniref:Homoserine O-acetyltransferase n=1 Tax=Marivirga tractuosa (strain ATCC 23168 / DSM 4126 / NBRC 15989 / NCIMB 1408 / VKM B-1430 / H-43) TaxID=643867 RepID=E4TVM4_MARTH|nr:homoserine O-acetyltransferase [Marivirga tractuosa]ADR21137.1 Homoserine O-acetyltransferase [Marivirga tractuosa DSM 4126]BDD14408.1 homoserine O-acetyltransferase [Marivirga tractuosa]